MQAETIYMHYGEETQIISGATTSPPITGQTWRTHPAGLPEVELWYMTGEIFSTPCEEIQIIFGATTFHQTAGATGPTHPTPLVSVLTWSIQVEITFMPFAAATEPISGALISLPIPGAPAKMPRQL